MAETKPTPVAKLSFEAAMTELESVVVALEKGEVALEQSIALYERGAQLRSHCDALLQKAEEKVSQIKRDAEGKVLATPLDAE